MPGFVILLLVLVVAAIPIWPYSAGWGFRPAGVLTIALGLSLLSLESAR